MLNFKAIRQRTPQHNSLVVYMTYSKYTLITPPLYNADRFVKVPQYLLEYRDLLAPVFF